MPDMHLHIISFDIPYPPNYGGIIDVYYKLVALKRAGVKIHLHCYEYGRKPAQELEQWCENVYYYPRSTGIWNSLYKRPYIVQSRRSKELINRLIQDEYPILFEGLHSCYFIDDKRLKNRKKIYRESNIEHHYYYHLFKAERNLLRKPYFLLASLKLFIYQKILKHASLMLVVSQSDTLYLQQQFPGQRVVYLPSFHPNDEFSVISGRGYYALYHGKLSVMENYQAAKYLIEKVFRGSDYQLIIAGLDPPESLTRLAQKYVNVSVVPNPDDDTLFGLIRNAHVNVLVTFQPTGLKLKLLNTLYQGRFCLVNKHMVTGTGLDQLCEIANSDKEMKIKIDEVFKREFKHSEVERRKELLKGVYSNKSKAEKLIKLVFE
ncbi:MAG: glycosyltransferase family 1 protein [Bacteroidales bacterium]|jgi:hypothetical protein|nr:glycosyltransferase family 1 protein [Bacteroidales bacterium]